MKPWSVPVLAAIAFSQAALAQTAAPQSPTTKPKLEPSSISRFLGTRDGKRAMTELGEVTVSVCVSAEGFASDAKIVKSSGNDQLDRATQKMLAGARYKAATDANGNPIAMCEPPYLVTWAWTPPPR
jgi:TonB family protein